MLPFAYNAIDRAAIDQTIGTVWWLNGERANFEGCVLIVRAFGRSLIPVTNPWYTPDAAVAMVAAYSPFTRKDWGLIALAAIVPYGCSYLTYVYAKDWEPMQWYKVRMRFDMVQQS
ncbi:unnamed protein product [Soboliphyme baturini]|uniref:Uncharacterized protein n=1 Tax=Soboliphyme baturini TaxID=241478 RepID=A0A3P8C9Y8_9BILA|nr:unnamed protein product [Soboliphyme baturini]